MAALDSGRNRREVNRTVFDQIMAVDDFLTFKKLMVKRNMELELEAVEALRVRVRVLSTEFVYPRVLCFSVCRFSCASCQPSPPSHAFSSGCERSHPCAHHR